MYVIRQMIYAYAFSAKLEDRSNKILVNGLFAVILLTFGAMIDKAMTLDPDSVEWPRSSISITLSTAVVCSLVYAFIVAWIYSSKKVKIGEAIYAAALGYICEHAFYCLANLMRMSVPEINSFMNLSVYGLIESLIFAFLSYRILASRMTRDGHYIAQSLEIGVLLVTVIALVMVLSSMASEGDYVPLHSMYSFIFCLFILISQLERQQALQREREAGIREQLLISAQAQYRTYQENSELLSRKAHDLKHQMAALRMLHDGEEGQQVINSIADTVRIYDSYVRTGNEQLDTILTQKNQICLENDILFTCMVNGRLLAFMEPVDLFTLFGNMLDNAIEAVKDLPAENRSISLEVSEKMGMVRIREENPCKAVDIREGKLFTTKQDRENHGFGVRSMELVAQKYDGVLSYEAENDSFVLTIMFYLTK